MNICQTCTRTFDICSCIIPKLSLLNGPNPKRRRICVKADLRRKVLESETTRYHGQEDGILKFSTSKIHFSKHLN